MKLETFNKKNSVYEDFKNKITKLMTMRSPMPAKECIVKNFEILNAVVDGFQSQYVTDGDGNITNKVEIDNQTQSVSVFRISKKEIPPKWTGIETLNAQFLIHDWDE